MSLQKKEGKDEKALHAIVELEDYLFLANTEASKIFIKTEEGIISSTRAIEKLNPKQRTYYTWLRRNRSRFNVNVNIIYDGMKFSRHCRTIIE